MRQLHQDTIKSETTILKRSVRTNRDLGRIKPLNWGRTHPTRSPHHYHHSPWRGLH